MREFARYGDLGPEVFSYDERERVHQLLQKPAIASEGGEPDNALTPEVTPEEPKSSEIRQFEKLNPEAQAYWQSAIERKLYTNKKENTKIPPEQVACVEAHLQDIVARVHEKFGTIEGDVPEQAKLLFDGLLEQIVIVTEDRERSDKKAKYIGSAHSDQGVIGIYPEFFRARGDGERSIDQAHIIAHELGELAYKQFEQSKQIDQFKHLKPGNAADRDGDYVNSESPTEKFREEFAETFGDWLTSSSNVEMLMRRIERYKDKSEFQGMVDTEEGQRHLDYLLSQSTILKTFFDHAMPELTPTLKAEMERRAELGFENEFDPYDMFDMMDPSSHGLEASRAGQLHGRQKKPGFLSQLWGLITGKSQVQS